MDNISHAISEAAEIQDRLERLFLVQLRDILTDYVYLSENTKDPALRSNFETAAAWIEGRTRLNIGGQDLTFEEAMSEYLGLPMDSEEFTSRFYDFKRTLLRKANEI